ncbi:MAG: adenosylmethionine--8-amino-7-oxononanoate transaminase [Desulfobacterales bacterium]|nr:adenosylmethionine--8-amino-7-oxononanoate transaminase [Desulfobacterales bacterium]MBF0396667.1 adenosylmethionine--8-amino-7-oxononanoate transaminase [Desulfobacterales bacterium]
MNIKQLEIDDKKYIWHPFTQMQDYETEITLIIAEGKGSLLIDVYGKEYIDGVSSLWTNVHGHRKEALDLAIKNQIDKIAHSTLLGISNVPAIEFAKKLIQIAPKGLTKVFYSDNGSTAVEVALKMAFQYHQQAKNGDPKRLKFISFKNAYHGDTIGSVSIGGIDLFHGMFKPLLFENFKAEAPYCYRCPFNKSHPSCNLICLNHVEEIMREHGSEVCGLIIEPLIQGAGGMIVHPKGFLKGVRELCSKYNILMIVDEVAVGFGKTGKMFACEHEEVIPDIMALAKGITGGYLPLAATLASEKIFEGFLGKYEEFKTFFHGHTFTGNPLACAVAIANLEIFENEYVLDKLQEKIAFLNKKLKSFYELKHVGDIRQIGIMAGIEIVFDKNSKKIFEPKQKVSQKIIFEARNQGLVIRPLGNVIVLMPPLCITIEEIERLCNITFESIRKITENV